jgi:tetratricopeptide (TPR) repeat protein
VGSGVARRDVIFGIGLAGIFSGMSVDAFLELLDELDGQAANAGPILAATLRSFRARVEYGAGTGTLEALRAATRTEIEMLEQTGSFDGTVAAHMYERVVVPWLDGDAVAFERGSRERVEATSRVATRLYHANSLAEWAIALCEIGDAERASAAIAEARALADPDDLADQITLDLAEAYVHALEREPERARQFLERARARAKDTDLHPPAFDSEFVEARVRLAMGEVDGARRLLEALARDQEERGFHRIAERYRRELAALDGSP